MKRVLLAFLLAGAIALTAPLADAAMTVSDSAQPQIAAEFQLVKASKKKKKSKKKAKRAHRKPINAM